MQSAEVVLALLLAVATLVTVARGLGIAYPIFLVIGGLLVGLVPGVPRIRIDPDLIFLLVLPPLLYVSGFFQHREIKRTVIDSEREALLRLRAEGAIDDDVLRHLEHELDLEERRMDA